MLILIIHATLDRLVQQSTNPKWLNTANVPLWSIYSSLVFNSYQQSLRPASDKSLFIFQLQINSESCFTSISTISLSLDCLLHFHFTESSTQSSHEVSSAYYRSCDPISIYCFSLLQSRESHLDNSSVLLLERKHWQSWSCTGKVIAIFSVSVRYTYHITTHATVQK